MIFFQVFFSQLHKLCLLLRFAFPLLHVTVRTAVRLSPWSSSSSKAGTIPTWHTLKTKQEKRSSLFSRLICSRTYGLLIRTFMASSPCKPYRQKMHYLPVRDYVFHLMVEFYLQQGLCFTSSSTGLLYLLGPNILQHLESLFIVNIYQTKLTELYYSYCILLKLTYLTLTSY